MIPLVRGRPFLGERINAPYALLKYLEPGLLLDVGAAAGHTAALMLDMSPASKLEAFEPNVENLRFFTSNIGSLATLHPVAVSDLDGDVSFVVPSKISGTEPGWTGMAGYSSAGMIASAKEELPTTRVKSVRIDTVVAEHVRFIKIDTQGAELRVLRGAEKLLKRQQVDMLLIEFSGKMDVVEELAGHGYRFIDTLCVLHNQRTSSIENWDVIRQSSLSTGAAAVHAWPTPEFPSVEDYSLFLEAEHRRLKASVWTDLLCVSEAFYERFAAGAAALDGAHERDTAFSMTAAVQRLRSQQGGGH